jgi:hypothetical protein
LNSLTGNSAGSSAEALSDVQITLTLPAEIASAIQQSSQQPIGQQILALLQQAVSVRQPLEQPPEAKVSQSSPVDASLRQEVEQLKHRLSLLEALLPRVEAIEKNINDFTGKTASPRPENDRATPAPQASAPLTAPAIQNLASAPEPRPAGVPSDADKPQEQDKDGNPGSAIASLWMQVQQNNHPPASIPSTLQPVDPCSAGEHRLMPFKSSGRSVCIKCGWTDTPRSDSSTAPPVNVSDLHQLLEQAAIESLENMKPRKRST